MKKFSDTRTNNFKRLYSLSINMSKFLRGYLLYYFFTHSVTKGNVLQSTLYITSKMRYSKLVDHKIYINSFWCKRKT